jgi:photosystem II stability/assembly factor-like uncharacterized protein
MNLHLARTSPRGRRLFRFALGASPALAALLLAAVLLRSQPQGLRPMLPGCAASCKCPRSPVAREGVEEGFSQVPGDGLEVRAPNPWFFLERAYPFGRIPREIWREAQFQARALREEKASRGSWDFRGPNNIGGRITDLAVDPADASVAFAAAAEGGVLRTTDSGQHWTPLFDQEAALSVGAIALDPLDSQIVYAGTGEVNPGGGSVAYGGIGVLRSTDHGGSWTPLGLEATGSIGRIRIDPSDTRRIYVAAMGDLWGRNPERGVYRSTDAGASWQRVLFVSDSTGAVDLVLRPDHPRTLFAAMWERIRHPASYQYGGTTCGVFRSTDGGDTWALVGGGLPAPSSNVGRIGLSLCAGQPDFMAAIYADRTGYFAGLYKSTNGGSTWTRTNDGALSSVYSSYGWWFGNVRIHPADPNRIFVLGLDFYRSTNGGSTWSETSGGMHVDHHALEFASGLSQVIYEGNDGGLYRSANGGTAWTHLPDQPITQFYRVALDIQTPARLYGGAQDNGTPRTLSGALNDWSDIYYGDGFQPLVDPTNSNRVWAQYQYGGLGYSSNGGGSFGDATTGISTADRHNWNTPVRMDPSNPNRMYYGSQRVYRSTNGTSWTAISPDLTGGAGGGSPGNVYGTLTTIDVSPLDGQVIWAGSDDGHVQITTNGGASWSDVSSALPDRWITSVRTSPLQRETCFVTLSGFRWNNPLPHIFRTTDLGLSWTGVAGNLPEAPANDVLQDPADGQRLIAATDLGVYETRDGGTTWGPLGNNLPNVVINQLALNPSSRVLVAATYGRSFFSYNIDQPSTVDLVADPPGAVDPPSPNPTRNGTWISWSLGATDRQGTEIELFSVSGRTIWRQRVEVDGSRSAQRLWWNGRDQSGRRVGAGTYYVRVRTGGRTLGGRTVVVF